MTSSSGQGRINLSSELFPVGYHSTILKLFVDSLERWKDVEILDVGPVCGENILFFARRMRRLYVCDMFLRLNRELRKGQHPGKICRHLDYPPRSFDGIQLWDLIDHLEDGEVSQLVEHCYTMLRATGLLMLIAFEKKPAPPLINTFVIDHDCRMGIRPQPHLDLPWHLRHNRALTSLLAGFTIVKSFRYHNGLREFLFKKPGLVRDF